MGAFYRFGLRGDRERAKDAVSEQTEAALGTDLQYSWMLAQCYALIEENDRAIHWLQNAVERGFVNYPLLSEKDPLLANLRNEPAFTDLMAEVETRWKNLDI